MDDKKVKEVELKEKEAMRENFRKMRKKSPPPFP